MADMYENDIPSEHWEYLEVFEQDDWESDGMVESQGFSGHVQPGEQYF